VDETAEGSEVLRKLRNHKVDTRFVAQVPDGMGMWLAIHDSTGDVVSSISKRPKMDAMLEMLEQHGDEIFADADSIVVEIDMDKEIIKQIIRYAEKYSVPVYALVANMSIASQRRDFLQSVSCFVCNVQEAGILFADEFEQLSPAELAKELVERLKSARIPSMVVTMGSQGAVWADETGACGICPAQTVRVRDTTGDIPEGMILTAPYLHDIFLLVYPKK
jgi:pseudouridine kinase